MIVTLCTERIRTLDDIRAFLDGNVAADITPHDRKAAYAFVERTLVRFRYHIGLSMAGQGLVRAFLAKVTGYSDAQLTRLITQEHRSSDIRDHRLRPPSHPASSRPAGRPTEGEWPPKSDRNCSPRRPRFEWTGDTQGVRNRGFTAQIHGGIAHTAIWPLESNM